MSQADALVKKCGKDAKTNIVFTTEYHPKLADMGKIIHKHLPSLFASDRMSHIFNPEKVRIMTGYRRSKNLKELLVPSNFPRPERQHAISESGCFKCPRTQCHICDNFLIETSQIESVVTKQKFKIRQHISSACRSTWVIYCALCIICNKQHIGSTNNFYLGQIGPQTKKSKFGQKPCSTLSRR